MGKMSIDKGKRYERRIAKILSEWSGIELVRTPDGAPEDLYADIWPKHTNEWFPLAVECKHVEDWSFDQIIQGTGQFYDWLNQAYSQAHNARTQLRDWYEPVLVFTKNRFPDMLCIGDLNSGWYTTRPVVSIAVNRATLFDGMVPEGYSILPLTDFLSSVSYDKMKQACTFYWV
jgi:hypothetical protein